MREEVAAQLVALNHEFYGQQAASFAASRAQPQPGFSQLLASLPQPCRSLLDVGCGEGRFGRFWQAHGFNGRYVGVDFSAELLAVAESQATGDVAFYQRDVMQAGALADFGGFDAVVCLAALHHIPGQARRQRLLRELADCLQENGRILISTWQFLGSERQRRKVRDWAEIGLSAADVEANDCLLTWQRGAFSYRYACLIDEGATAELAQAAHLQILHQFRSDGKEGDLALYTVLAQA